MSHLDRFRNISVLGAAGKMGSGILLLNVLHSAKLMHQAPYIGETFVINAIDQSFERLQGLMDYLKVQLLKWAEKNIVELRKIYVNRAHLIDNKDIIEAFVFEAMSMVKPTINTEAAYHSSLIFEAIIEDENIKAELFKNINENNTHEPYFLTNTSAIPIKVLNEKAGLDGRIIGCHFYNPPAVQKLIEVVELENPIPELTKIVHGLAKHMDKLIVPANDIAGFIGNGFFMREIIYAVNLYESLLGELSTAEALLTVDKVSHELLLRPMGIFQLMGYVGVDVCSLIMNVMDRHLDEELKCRFLNDLLDKGVRGGQNADGTQRDGFFKYHKAKAVEVIDLESSQYININELMPKIEAFLAMKTKPYSWSQLSRSKYKEKHIQEFFDRLKEEESKGAQLARDYLSAMKSIAQQLHSNGICDSTDHVNDVMKNGFYYLYGPVNNFID
ncbi:MAG: 3-hydroxyacyl-CoA dehydrogenase family protein [Carboxylicivirga sp.]|jgi:3-hydroxyacyl-CoA dehydrogenase|nr:3-hydroxyacyl-CoA dehydrogenase family protein [Carboxylicivirga sp.]